MKNQRILIACIGNIFLGDDGFGVEVARRLAVRPQPAGVRVIDFGIRGLDLTYALLEGYDAVIMVDAVPRDQPPGTLYLIEPDVNQEAQPAEQDMMVVTHNMDPVKVLRLAAGMGARLDRVLIVGCQPSPFTSEEELAMGLTPPVLAAVDEAILMIESLVEKILSEEVMAGT